MSESSGRKITKEDVDRLRREASDAKNDAERKIVFDKIAALLGERRTLIALVDGLRDEADLKLDDPDERRQAFDALAELHRHIESLPDG